MKKLLPMIMALPLLCLPMSNAYSINETPTESPRVCLGVQKKHKRSNKHRGKESQQLQEKCFGHSAKYSPIYYVKSIGADGETLITTDETVWQIASSSAHIARGWPENSTIVISPSNWYSKYDYYLTNTATLERVNAKLSQGPFLQYAIFINQINRYNNTITLSNGMSWQMASDRNFATWQVGQAVLLGINNSWFGSPNMIININENNYATGSRLY